MGKIQSKLELIKAKEPIDYAGQMAKIREERPVSYSSLKHFATSPWHFHEYYYGEKKVSTAFDVGNAFELMLLEPSKVDSHIIIMPEYGRSNADKALKEQFIKDNKGKLMVKEKELDTCFEMYERAIKNEKLMEIVNKRANVQKTIFWTDPKTKLKNVSKIDFDINHDEIDFAIVDLKTAISADPRQFPRAVINFDYWLQGGSYTLAYQRKYFMFPDYYWVVVENKPPYGINIFKADNKLMDSGKRYYENLLLGLKMCYDNNLWHMSHEFWHFTRPYDIIEKPTWLTTKI